VLITRRSNCINTASGIVFSISDRPVCRLRRDWFLLNQFLLNLHTGRSLTEEIVPSQSVPSQPAHRTVTYRGTGSFSISSFSTCTPDGHLQRNWFLLSQFLLNLHTGRSLTEELVLSHSVPSQPAHRKVTYRGTGSFSNSSFSTCTPDGTFCTEIHFKTFTY